MNKFFWVAVWVACRATMQPGSCEAQTLGKLTAASSARLLKDVAIASALADLKTSAEKRPMDLHLQIVKAELTNQVGASSEAFRIFAKEGVRAELRLTSSSERGLAYGVYFIRERVMLGLPLRWPADTTVSPDYSFRMITEPFEVAGYANVNKLPRPFISERKYDPMRPFDYEGYSPEDEARSILRSGLNTIYLGSFTFASTYRLLSSNIVPKNSDAFKWVMERRSKFKELIAAAKKYHLNVCVNSDVFAYPKTVVHEDRYKALTASLNEVLTDFPEITHVISRFGENYSYFNPYLTGRGPKGQDELAAVIDTMQKVVVGKYKKVFIPRTWALGNNSWHASPKLYQEVTGKIKATQNTYFSIKNTQTDFWRYNKFNPNLGTGSKKQAIEYLCQDSYHYKATLPYYEVLRMSRGGKEVDTAAAGMARAKQMGIDYTWGWLFADGWCGPYPKREEWLKANVYGYTHLMWNANADPALLARQWAAQEFAVPTESPAATALAVILMRSEDLMLKMNYFSVLSKAHQGWIPHLNFTRDDVIGGSDSSYKSADCKYSAKPGTIKNIYNEKTYQLYCREKLEALALADSLLALYNNVKGTMPNEVQATEVGNTLQATRGLAAVISSYFNGMFHYYHGDRTEAIKYLQQWREDWTRYRGALSELPGAPVPVTDGGMVAACTNALNSLR